jgi:predicted nucleic acid-binding protein
LNDPRTNSEVFYLDASALIKAYVPERGSRWVAGIVSRERIMTSLLTLTEAASAFGRRAREGSLTAHESRTLFHAASATAMSFDLIGVSERIVQSAAQLVLRGLPLRAGDAIHLATAQESFILAQQVDPYAIVFVSADARLRESAGTLGLTVENPDEHE